MELGVGKEFAVVEGDLQLGVLAMEVVLQAVEVAGALPLAHGQVVEQIVAAGFGTGGRHLGLSENPLEALDGQASHVLYGVGSSHDDVHTREAPHRAYVDHVILGLAVAEPCGHEVLQTMHGGRSDSGFLVGFGDAQVEGGKPFVLA